MRWKATRPLSAMALALALALLVACGGGGNSPIEAAPVETRGLITAKNQERVTHEIVNTALTPLVVPPMGAPIGKAATGVPTKSGQTHACDRGSYTLDAPAVDNPNDLKGLVGLVTTITYDHCLMNGFARNGTLALETTKFDIGLNQLNVGSTLQFDGFSVSPQEEGEVEVAGATGELAMAMDVMITSELQPMTTLTYSSPLLSMTSTVAGHTVTRQLANYKVAMRTANNGDIVHVLQGELSLPAVGQGAVHFETVVPFTVTASPPNAAGPSLVPISGVMLVTGANGSKLRLTVQPDGQLLRELDEDGDGHYESIAAQPWSEYLSNVWAIFWGSTGFGG